MQALTSSEMTSRGTLRVAAQDPEIHRQKALKMLIKGLRRHMILTHRPPKICICCLRMGGEDFWVVIK